MRKPMKCSFTAWQFKGLHGERRSKEGLETTNQMCWKKWWVLWLSLMFFAESPSVLAQAKTPAKPATKSATTKSEAVAVFNTTGLAQKVFQIKHANVDKLAEILRIFGGVRADRDLRVIAVQVAPGVLPTVEDTVKRLDVPPPIPQNVELTVYLLLASDQDGSPSPVPADLEGVVKQLKITFALKSFRTLDTLVVRSRERGDGMVKGLARLDADAPQPSTFTFSYRAASILSDERGRLIRIDGLKLDADILVKTQEQGGPSAVSYQNVDAGFNTDIDVREGQKVVVGKAAIGGTNNALILVITAKVLE
jgi:Bacterial type II/III secretion system short domain